MQVIQQTYNSIGFSYKVEEPLILENGDILRDLRIHYTTYGQLNEDKSNVVWIFHALTGNSDPLDWWSNMIGEGYFINPEDHFIVCANVIGSCYGSTEPNDFDFPVITVGDMVHAHQLLKEYLGLERISIGIGGSLGGQQLLEWATQEPDLFETIIPIATNARHSAWGIAFNEAQRMAIKNDPEFGIETARAIAMLSYRNYQTYEETQTDSDGRSKDFSASSYQQYQGQKLKNRFSPFSYYSLSKSMDSHNVGRHFGSVENALSRIQSKAILIGIESDVLFPIHEQKEIAKHIPYSSFFSVESLYGHDGFLIEGNAINTIIKQQLQ